MSDAVAAARSLPASIVGVEAGPIAHEIDARWLMAYAAGLGEDDQRYFDTTRAGGVLAHPMFAVCYEWPLALEVRAKAIDPAIWSLGVHATHRLVIHRPPRAGDTLMTTARVLAAEPRRSGTLVTVRFTTVDAAGAPVTTTEYGSVYRGVKLAGNASGPETTETEDRPGFAGAVPSAGGLGGPFEAPHVIDRPVEAPHLHIVDIVASAAHVYTECARIWNAIHTDAAVAKTAGLPGIILHGTATLALAVSRVLRHAGVEPDRVRGVRGRFTGMVPLPSRFTVRGGPRGADSVAFDAIGEDGRSILADGGLDL
jgi:acyl dehydratase